MHLCRIYTLILTHYVPLTHDGTDFVDVFDGMIASVTSGRFAFDVFAEESERSSLAFRQPLCEDLRLLGYGHPRARWSTESLKDRNIASVKHRVLALNG